MLNYPFYQPQSQSNGLINIPNESMARNYPVAYGTTVTFKDENLPYIYTKTMGYSQSDIPIFEKYRREEEKPPVIEPKEVEPTNLPLEDIKTEISEIRALYEEIKEKVDKPKRTVKKEVVDDE